MFFLRLRQPFQFQKTGLCSVPSKISVFFASHKRINLFSFSGKPNRLAPCGILEEAASDKYLGKNFGDLSRISPICPVSTKHRFKRVHGPPYSSCLTADEVGRFRVDNSLLNLTSLENSWDTHVGMLPPRTESQPMGPLRRFLREPEYQRSSERSFSYVGTRHVIPITPEYYPGVVQ